MSYLERPKVRVLKSEQSETENKNKMLENIWVTKE